MLELGETTTEFEMYKGEKKYTTNEDGSLILNSISPMLDRHSEKEDLINQRHFRLTYELFNMLQNLINKKR